ncbi:hypothetical protein GCM10007386_05390 [Pseudoduganella dura]|nr:hypothetical protein GCM10007386_05390 [Pseudoduganella dura]
MAELAFAYEMDHCKFDNCKLTHGIPGVTHGMSISFRCRALIVICCLLLIYFAEGMCDWRFQATARSILCAIDG